MTSPNPILKELSPKAAEALLKDSFLLDVRTPSEFAEAHLPGSVLEPLGDLDPRKVKEMAAKHAHCLIICRSGNRARQAAKKLEGSGMANLAILDGGVQAWDAAGLPLNRGQRMMSLERQVRIAAGSLVVIGVGLALFVNPLWLALPGFVGAGLVFAGITDTCGMGMLLAKMPWNQRGIVTGCNVNPNQS